MPEEQERSLDEAEVECHLPREDESPPVARACDARAGQHPARRHPDELPPNAAAQDGAVAKNLNVIKRHPVRAIDHDPSPALASSEGREGAGCAARCCARGSRARAYQRVRKRYAPSDPGGNRVQKIRCAASAPRPPTRSPIDPAPDPIMIPTRYLLTASSSNGN